jgi:pseudoazurin
MYFLTPLKMEIDMKSFYLAITLLASSPAFSAEVTVEMLNNKDGQMYAYSTKIVKVAVGDTVTWKATNAGHNAVFVQKGFPEGAAPLDNTPIGKDVSYTFDKPGIYMVKCNPHYGLGMLQAVVVGNDMSNLEQVKAASYPGKAKANADEIFAELSKG